jgi:hypothetical protein
MPIALTYRLISTVTLSSTATSVTFSSIPQTYTDLVLVSHIKGTNSAYNFVEFSVGNNSVDTSSIYSVTGFAGRYNAAVGGNNELNSDRYTSLPAIYVGMTAGFAKATSTFSTHILNLQDYRNTTTFKTFLARNSGPDQTDYVGVSMGVGLWRSTSAINTITYTMGNANFDSGCNFKLFGIGQ